MCASFLFCLFSVVIVRKCDGSWQIYLAVCTYMQFYVGAILCGFRILLNFSLGLLGRTCLLRDCPFVFLGEGYRKGERVTLDTFF